jgi:multidrug efflux pump subunit AcrB
MVVDPAFWQDPSALDNIYVSSNTGGIGPLSAFTHYGTTTAPIAVNHSSVFPSVTYSFNLAPGVALGDAVKLINAAQHKVGIPSTVLGSFSGTAQAFSDSLASEPLLIASAIAAVYVVLGVLYESYIHPITILSTLPSAGVGALLALLITHTELTVIALIGIILLIGIVKKNAIIMIDFALEVERRENAFLSARESEVQVKLRQLTASVSLINDLGGGWETSQLDRTERMAENPPDAGKEPKIPANDAEPPVANPPSMPEGEIQPDDFVKMNDDDMAPR